MEITDGSGYGSGDGDGYGYGSGYGSGDGYGYGYGSGYGSGSGSGSGYGSGYGSGDGYGYGYGSGYGSGDGYGSGYGSGSGSGYGYGYGSGYGSGEDRKQYFTALLSQHRHGKAVILFWRSKPDGSPANGGSGGQAFVGKSESIEGPLKICTERGLHGTNDPTKWKGERWWIVALHEPVQQQEDKFASLTRTILADLGKCPF